MFVFIVWDPIYCHPSQWAFGAVFVFLTVFDQQADKLHMFPLTSVFLDFMGDVRGWNGNRQPNSLFKSLPDQLLAKALIWKIILSVARPLWTVGGRMGHIHYCQSHLSFSTLFSTEQNKRTDFNNRPTSSIIRLPIQKLKHPIISC